ncbi:MAG: proteasome-type protease [Burkholderiales bacterium]|jgi:putative proteasome-type protease|nr:proteasome-type protease [Burkholderiales bacterium]
MTYCVAIKLNQGMVFLSDTRTNAGVDLINRFRKMTVFEIAGERTIVLMTAGNLSISQSVVQRLQMQGGDTHTSLWNVRNMFDAAQLVGQAIRDVYEADAKALQDFDVSFNVSFIVGGQIRGEEMRLFQVYSAGNFIEATAENPFFQIGEAKYGKPILDRVITTDLCLDDAAKCALVSMDSTLQSNISVGLPLDLLVYEFDALRVTKFSRITDENPYFQMIHREWGKRLRNTFEEIPPPIWNAHPDLSVSDETDQLVRPIIAQRRSNAVAVQPSTDVSAPESVQPIVIQTMA